MAYLRRLQRNKHPSISLNGKPQFNLPLYIVTTNQSISLWTTTLYSITLYSPSGYCLQSIVYELSFRNTIFTIIKRCDNSIIPFHGVFSDLISIVIQFNSSRAQPTHISGSRVLIISIYLIMVTIEIIMYAYKGTDTHIRLYWNCASTSDNIFIIEVSLRHLLLHKDNACAKRAIFYDYDLWLTFGRNNRKRSARKER